MPIVHAGWREAFGDDDKDGDNDDKFTAMAPWIPGSLAHQQASRSRCRRVEGRERQGDTGLRVYFAHW